MFLTMREDMLILFLTIYRGLVVPFLKHSRVDILSEHLETEEERTHKPSRKMDQSHRDDLLKEKCKLNIFFTW